MVFKPLCVLADGLGAACGYKVLVRDDAFPRSLDAKRIAIHLDEAVDEVDATFLLLEPLYGILVEDVEVACTIITDEQIYDFCLLRVFSHFCCLLQPIDNVLDGMSVKSAFFPYVLMDGAVGMLPQGGI